MDTEDQEALDVMKKTLSLNEKGSMSSFRAIVKHGINPQVYIIGQEILDMKKQNMSERRRKLIELFQEDFVRESYELERVNLAYMNLI